VAKDGVRVEVGARAGHAVIARDHFATLRATAAMEAGDVAVDLVAPLRYRILDASPLDGGPEMALRRLDWDEPSEWLRPLRRLAFGRSGEAIYGRVGRLSGATLGHGSVVLGYHNNLLPDHGRAGLRMDVDVGRWGAQLFINDVVTWEVLAARAFLRPLEDSPSRLLRSITVATTFAADLKAPLRATTDAEGALVFDERGILEAERDSLTLYGLDLGVEVWRSDAAAVVPYLDLNLLPRPAGKSGWGAHGGLYVHIRPGDPVFELILRYEARLESGNYEAAWFDTMYELDRFQHFRTSLSSRRPKLGWHRPLLLGDSRIGHLIDGELRIRDRFRVTARYQRLAGDGSGGDDAAMLAVNLPPTREVELDGFIALRPAPDKRFEVVAAGALRWRFWRPLYVFVDYHRAWHVMAEVTPRMDVTDDWSWRLGARSTF